MISLVNSELAVDFFCENQFQQKIEANKKNDLALRTNNSSLGESYLAIPQAPYLLTNQKQCHLFKIENGFIYVYIFYFHNWSKEY